MEEGFCRPVSRVLFSSHTGRMVTIYLAQLPAVKPAEVRFWRSDVTVAVEQPTRGRAGHLSPPIWPCSRWGLAAAASPQTAGRSYRPISPLSLHRWKDGMFLCHFPFPISSFRTYIGTWELPSTLPRGARTFLPSSIAGRTAVTQSALPSNSNSSIGSKMGQTKLNSQLRPHWGCMGGCIGG